MLVATKLVIQNTFWGMSQRHPSGRCCQQIMFLLPHSKEKAAVIAVAVECLGPYLGMYLATTTSLRSNLICILTCPNAFRRGKRKYVALCYYVGHASETYC